MVPLLRASLTDAAITHLLNETTSSFHQELKSKQSSIDSLHSSLRSTSTQLGDARRQAETLSNTLKKQQIARQALFNLAHMRSEESLRAMQADKEQRPSSWETELSTILESSDDPSTGFLPSPTVLRTRIKALQDSQVKTKNLVKGLQSKSRDVEVKYRHVVSLCTGVPENDVDAVIDGLIKAVESERDELDIGRVRRFLGGVEGVVH